MSTSSNTIAAIPSIYWRTLSHMGYEDEILSKISRSQTDADPSPLSANPTLAQIRAHEEEKLKKDKVITCLHSGLADHIFTKIMGLETPKILWDKLQGEFEGISRVKTI
uniref:Uncharacterized protein n=1 Tax=Salix viminalis TaxID=40686 RepID=A0A6N2MPA4_SALVM